MVDRQRAREQVRREARLDSVRTRLRLFAGLGFVASVALVASHTVGAAARKATPPPPVRHLVRRTAPSTPRFFDQRADGFSFTDPPPASAATQSQSQTQAPPPQQPAPAAQASVS
jgi:hypothetical protein